MAGAKPKYRPEMIDTVLAAAEEMEADTEFKVFVSKAKLANRLDVCEATVDNWAAKYPRFGEAIERLKCAQKDKMIVGGLTGVYNSKFTQFVLSASYGMSEKSAVEVSGNKNAPLTIHVETDSDGAEG